MKELCPAEALHEECGVFGIYDSTGKTNMVSAVYSALYALQHRGQESCGIALNVDGVLTGYRDLGLVSEVFTPRVLADLPQDAKMATGHVRYATSGQRTRANAQPMVLHHCKGTMAICHNGNLTNAPQLRHKLEMNGSIFHGTSDTEVIGYLLTQNRLISPDIETAVCRTMEQIVGAYSLVIMTHTKLIAARDPNGFRPLCIGQLPDGSGWAFASESCALDAVGAHFVRDVLPGEIVVADYTGLRTIRTHCGTAPHTMCVFEYIYFARPDSIIEGTCVHDARLQAILESERRGENPNGKVTLVVASKPGVYALERAANFGVETAVVRRKDYATSEEFDTALLSVLKDHGIELVVLAGFLSVLGPSVIAAYPNRILNIHPSLIPSFCGPGYYGLKVHEEALKRGVKVTGATVHFVNEVCDGGPILLQKAVEVQPGDTPEVLQKRVMVEAEWKLLPQAIAMVCNGEA